MATLKTLYYLILTQYVGPHRTGQSAPADGELRISTEPGRTNQSREVRLEGWLGTTNDTAEFAHGEFDTLELAQAAAAALGYTCVAGIEFPEEEAEHTWYGHPEVVEVRRTARDSRQQYDAADYLYATLGELGITAESTDADLDEIVKRLEAEAREDAIELYGTLRTLGFYRQELREEA